MQGVSEPKATGSRRPRICCPTLQAAIRKPGVTVIDCPVDYRENVFLTERLGALVCKD